MDIFSYRGIGNNVILNCWNHLIELGIKIGVLAGAEKPGIFPSADAPPIDTLLAARRP